MRANTATRTRPTPTGISRTLRRITGGEDESAPKRNGRPSDFDPYMVAEAAGMLNAGATDMEVCEALGITSATFYRWVRDIPGFREAVTNSKAAAIRVEASLYGRAVGKATKRIVTTEADGTVTERVEHLPADPRAQQLYLLNKAPDRWRNRTEHELIVPETGPALSPEEQDMRHLALAAIALMNEAAELPVLDGAPYDTPTTETADGDDQEDWAGEPDDLDL